MLFGQDEPARSFNVLTLSNRLSTVSRSLWRAHVRMPALLSSATEKNLHGFVFEKLVLQWDCLQGNLTCISALSGSLALFRFIWKIRHRCAREPVNHDPSPFKTASGRLKKQRVWTGPCSGGGHVRYIHYYDIFDYFLPMPQRLILSKEEAQFSLLGSQNPDLHGQCLEQITVYIRNFV